MGQKCNCGEGNKKEAQNFNLSFNVFLSISGTMDPLPKLSHTFYYIE
jgi:hypothetical protein